MVGIIFSDMKIIPQTSCTCIGVIFILFFTNRREKDVCTNKNYRTRKSGKETKRYYATVYDSVAKNPYAGPLREKRSEALTDESKIRREMEMQRKDGASSKAQSKTLTVAELYAAWQPHAQKTLAAPTYKVYAGYYSKYIEPVFGIAK